jgi:hypothetical protein
MVALSHLQGFPDLALFDEPGSQRLKSVEKRSIYVLSCHQRVPMQKHAMNGAQQIPAARRWSRSRARCICPRRHLRVLPTRTRPSLFGGD